MFGILKKKLNGIIEQFKKKKEEEIEKEVEKKVEKKPKKVKAKKIVKMEEKKKSGLFERVVARVAEKTLSKKDVEDFLEQFKLVLMENDVALEVAEKMSEEVKKELIGKKVRRGQIEKVVEESLKEAILNILKQERIDLVSLAKKNATIVFVGFNGCGKTTTIAKVAFMLKKKGIKPVLAAADTFRAAAIEQLRIHAQRLNCKIVEHQYGSDAAAVVFDARKYVESKGGVVLADTAGRTHSNANLMDELKKIIRVNKPDLKILVVDSLTGNDAVEQAEKFNQAIDIDAVILTKADVNEKGGAALSVGYVIGKPILFLGTGQEYEDLVEFKPEEIVKRII